MREIQGMDAVKPGVDFTKSSRSGTPKIRSWLLESDNYGGTLEIL
jgi:hypothetical protein